MIQKIRVITRIGPGLKGEGILSDIQNMLGVKEITKVRAVKVYRLEGISRKQAEFLAENLLSENINQSYTLNKIISEGSSRLRSNNNYSSSEAKPNREVIIEIAYKPGVMNPEVASIIKAAKDLGVDVKAADASYEYAFYGPSTSLRVKKEKLLEIIDKLNLFNKLTEHIIEKDLQTLIITGYSSKSKIIPIRNISDSQLIDLSKDKLFLNLEEMKVIQHYFENLKRDPTDLELETIAQTWSEHSGHKTFRAELIVDGVKKEALIKRIKKEALKHDKNIVSAFVDNSGVMDFYDGFAICGKVETHNSPSAIEPYGGATTGSGGVFRDIAATGLGAKNIASTDIFCLAEPDSPSEELPDGCLPPDYLLKKLVHGVKDYGNRMGIPTNNGSIHFHKDFRAKPTVIVGAYGILPKAKAQIGVPKKGDLIVSMGGKIGRDGIHGATFSSAEMTDKTIGINSSAVQIGNAIEEKRMFDALLEARDQDLIRAVQDVGGGGLSSAVGELGKDLGVRVDIKNAKIKYSGLSPWEIWVSESQERMVVVLEKRNLKKLEEICKKYDVEISYLGEFDGSKKLNVYFGKEKISDLDMKFLHEGLPKKVLVAKKPSVMPANAGIQLKKYSSKMDPRLHPKGTSHLMMARGDDAIKESEGEKKWIDALESVLANPNIASKEPIVRLYDHSVGGTSELQPYSGVEGNGPNDAAVVRPFLNKKYGMIISHGLNPILNNIDAYKGSLWAGVEALSNYVAVGGDYREASLINNYIWPFPDEESLFSLDQSVDAVVDLMKTFKIPVISGKDSLSSTYRGKGGLVIKIPPVLCISVFGRITDTTKTVTADFKRAGSAVILVGKQDLESMGGSIYLEMSLCHAEKQSDEGYNVPDVNVKLLPELFTTIFNAIQKGKILSCHDVSDGGLITSVFEMCIGGDMGIDLSIGNIKRPDYFLFNETVGTFVIEVENEEVAKKVFKDIPYRIIGKTKTEKEINVKNVFNVKLEQLKKVWEEPMRRMFP